MGRVCLILPLTSASAPSADWVARRRRGLEAAGHSVRVLAVAGARGREHEPDDPDVGAWTTLQARGAGLTSAAMTGLAEAEADADYLVVLDPSQGYHPEDLARVVAPLADGSADLVVARRVGGETGPGRRMAGASFAALARPLVGVSDLMAGLVAVSSRQSRAISGSFNPVGSRFAADLLFRSTGRRVEVPVRAEGPPAPVALRLDDLRHVKRLADDRLGNASRLLQFCAVGASGMIVDLSAYAAFQLGFSRTWLASRPTPVVGGPLDLAAAGALAIAVALTWNFSLNRRLTFSYARQGSIVRQYLTYTLSNALGIALSFSLRLYLPAHFGFFQSHKLAAAVVGIVAATGISFSMSRWLVFRARGSGTVQPPHAAKEPRAVVTSTSR